MQNPPQRSVAEVLEIYRNYLLSKVSKVRILGEADERELKDVFVELSIVEQHTLQQHAEFLGMMDSAMRRRLNPFADEDIDTTFGVSGQGEKEIKRRVRLDELLRRRAKAIVMGAPGCGKTTLLKYLARQAQEKGKRLAVWLELKAIDKPLFAQAEKAAARNGNLILPELWLKHLKAQLSLSDWEIKLLRGYWQERFKTNEIAVFLDGFDELQDEAIERSLNKCVREFASAAHDNTLLISMRPYAQHKLGKERLQELEIEPLNQRQIEAFLNCYYPNDAATKSLLKTLRERSSLRELLHVPLLLCVVSRLIRENSFTDERLKLYEAIIADLIHRLDRSKSVNRRFKIYDEELRLDFLKFLAFERLLRDPLGQEEQEVNRIVFSYDLLKEKACTFLAQEYPSHNPRDLANDALSTPLLREVGANAYAFTHLTLQEYLAACAFAAFYQRKGNEFEGLKIFCRAYHDPTLVEMEVLPMMLGALSNADKLYAEIERWPESLTFANLRLRARGLSYAAKIKQGRLSNLIDRLLEFISEKNSEEAPYAAIVINSFAGVSHKTMTLIETKAAPLIKTDAPDYLSVAETLGRIGSDAATDVLVAALQAKNRGVRREAAWALARLSSGKTLTVLIAALQHKDSEVRESAARALGQLGSDQAVDALIAALQDKVIDVHLCVAEALGQIGSDKAIEALVMALQGEDGRGGVAAAAALEKVGSDKAIGSLIAALRHQDRYVRWSAADALGKVGSDAAVEALIAALQTEDSDVRRDAAWALGKSGSDKAVDALVAALQDKDRSVRSSTAHALAALGSDKAVDMLIAELQDKNSRVRWSAAYALNHSGSNKAVDALITALQDEDSEVRGMAATALGQSCSDKAVEALVPVLLREDRDVRWSAAAALGRIGSVKAVNALIMALRHDDSDVRFSATQCLKDSSSDKAVDALIAALQDEDSRVRWWAAIALGRSGLDKAVEALIAAVQDEDRFVRGSAAVALGRIGSDKAIDALIAAAQDEYSNVRNDAAEALAQMKVKALISGLAGAIKHRDAFARKKAVLVIGYYSDDERMLEQLKHLSQTDKDSAVREAASEAAEKLARKLELLGHLVTEGTAQPLSDNESRELFLVGEAFKVAAEAGHIFRPTPNSDWGIDGEIEFKDDKGEASGRRVYLQLKSGDSYLRTRKTDGKEIFTVKARHAKYWQSHTYPVLLVIRDSSGQIRWMNVTEYLHRHGTSIRQIEFQGEPFAAESVRQMRDRFAR